MLNVSLASRLQVLLLYSAGTIVANIEYLSVAPHKGQQEYTYLLFLKNADHV